MKPSFFTYWIILISTVISISACTKINTPDQLDSPSKSTNNIQDSSSDTLTKIQMNWTSMYPTVKDWDILKYTKNLTALTHGNIVVIESKWDKYIKRIIGMSWDTIRFSDGKVFLKKNGNNEFAELIEPFLSGSNINNTQLQSSTGDTFILPENMYWVMGDNRQNSSDSRECFMFCSWKDPKEHFLDRSQILGIILQ